MNVVLQHAGKWLHFQHPERVLRTARLDEVVPMLREAESSGLFAAGFVSYEAAPAFDAALKTHPADGFPLLCLGLFSAPEVLETIEMHEVGGRRSVGAVYNGADQERGSDGASPSIAAYEIGELAPSVSKEAFVAAIGAIKERIAEGATYQVNFTYRLQAPFSGDAWAFFHDLVTGQRAGHAAFVDTGDFAVCSASPELFFHCRDGRIVSRPMKGTARRGRTFAEDARQAEALRNSEKDRAENIMIVDMVRNDIGRIAVPGSVETTATFEVEKYPTVWQMTSTVQGILNTEGRKESKGSPGLGGLCALGVKNTVEVLSALFPCASITGAPKAKTMEIIRGLEGSPRNIYTGAIGFAAPDGEACFNVAIRTALIDRAHGSLEFGVGGGIVWDSDAAAEYEETLTKARVLTQSRPDFRLLETILWEPDSGIFLLDGHLQRLGKSAAYFDVPLDAFELVHALEERCATLEPVPHRLRLLVARNGAFEVEAVPFVPRPDALLRVALAKEPVDSNDLFLFHKTTHREIYDRARSACPDCDDTILWNEKGEVTEGTISNVVVRMGGRLLTPPVGCGLLAGTFREHLLKTGAVEEGIVTREALLAADEVFLVNSVRKWQKASITAGGIT